MAYFDWKMSTKQIGTCSCDYGCPCEFNAPPTRPPCEGVMAMWRHLPILVACPNRYFTIIPSLP